MVPIDNFHVKWQCHTTEKFAVHAVHYDCSSEMFGMRLSFIAQPAFKTACLVIVHVAPRSPYFFGFSIYQSFFFRGTPY